MKRYPPFIVFAVLALVTIPTRVPEASRTLTPTPPTQECAPPFYSLDAVLTCYLPMHVAEAESRLGTSPPVSPISAVSQTVGLTLSKVIVEQSQRQYYYHPSLAFGIAYLFGRFPGNVGPGCLPPPPPAYVFVVEHVGRPELQPGVGLGQATYTTTNTKTGATYHTACPWQLEAALPGRGLLLQVSSNLGYEAVEGIGAHPGAHPALRRAVSIQRRQSTYRLLVIRGDRPRRVMSLVIDHGRQGHRATGRKTARRPCPGRDILGGFAPAPRLSG